MRISSLRIDLIQTITNSLSSNNEFLTNMMLDQNFLENHVNEIIPTIRNVIHSKPCNSINNEDKNTSLINHIAKLKMIFAE